jgi:hypothetical protein
MSSIICEAVSICVMRASFLLKCLCESRACLCNAAGS